MTKSKKAHLHRREERRREREGEERKRGVDRKREKERGEDGERKMQRGRMLKNDAAKDAAADSGRGAVRILTLPSLKLRGIHHSQHREKIT